MSVRLRLVGLSLAVLAVAYPAAAQDSRRVEVGASLVNLMIVFPVEGDKSVLFGIPSGSFGLLSPSVYAAIFATPRVAIEPQAGVLLVSTGGDTNHVVNIAGQVDYFLNGSAVAEPRPALRPDRRLRPPPGSTARGTRWSGSQLAQPR